MKVPTKGTAAAHEGSEDKRSWTGAKRRSEEGKHGNEEKKGRGVLARWGRSRRHRCREGFVVTQIWRIIASSRPDVSVVWGKSRGGVSRSNQVDTS